MAIMRLKAAALGLALALLAGTAARANSCDSLARIELDSRRAAIMDEKSQRIAAAYRLRAVNGLIVWLQPIVAQMISAAPQFAEYLSGPSGELHRRQMAENTMAACADNSRFNLSEAATSVINKLSEQLQIPETEKSPHRLGN